MVAHTNGSSSASTRWRQPSLSNYGACAIVVIMFYAAVVTITYQTIFLSQLPIRQQESTPADEFSEGRAAEHVVKLAGDIGFRMEGRSELAQGKAYILSVVKALQAKAGPQLRVEVDEFISSGSFPLYFLNKNITLAYTDVSSIIVRISNSSHPSSADGLPSVLVNGHYDSAYGSQGAADCAACVAPMLEVLRLYIESTKVPSSPLIFLFNGGEEVFMKAVHGFVTQHPWSPTVGVMVNYEASGASLPDGVIQAGPEFWPMEVYGRVVTSPTCSSLAQEIFPHIPGDTDFRIFTADFDDVPGLDIAFVLNGYVYHTVFDTPENLMPGALQQRGENLIALLDGLAASKQLRTRQQRQQQQQQQQQQELAISAASLSNSSRSTHSSKEEHRGSWIGGGKDTSRGDKEMPVYFDFLGWGMVTYSRSLARSLDFMLIAPIFSVVQLSSPEASGSHQPSTRLAGMQAALLTSAAGMLLAILLPMLLAVARVAVFNAPMSWYAHAWTLYPTFLPAALTGLLLPHVLQGSVDHSQKAYPVVEAEEEASFLWSSHWGGSIALQALLCVLIGHVLGSSGSYFFFFWAAFMAPALAIYRLFRLWLGDTSPFALLGYFLPSLPPLLYSVAFVSMMAQFLAEKMGMSGTEPPPLGPCIPDVIMAAFMGLAACLIIAPLLPPLLHHVARPSFLALLISLSLLSASFLSIFLFPYSPAAPKRVAVFRVVWTQPHVAADSAGTPPHPSHSLSSASILLLNADSVPSSILFRHSPSLFHALDLDPALGFPQPTVTTANRSSVLGLYPVSTLLALPHSLPSSLPPRLLHPAMRLPLLLVEKEEEVCSAAASNRSSSSGSMASREAGREGGGECGGLCESSSMRQSCEFINDSAKEEGRERETSSTSRALKGSGNGGGGGCQEVASLCMSTGQYREGGEIKEVGGEVGGVTASQKVDVSCRLRLHLAVSLGDLVGPWVAVINITGPLSASSLSDQMRVTEYNGQVPSYIVHYSTSNPTELWRFNLEVEKGTSLQVELAVVDHFFDGEAKLRDALPAWTSVSVGTFYMSTYRIRKEVV